MGGEYTARGLGARPQILGGVISAPYQGAKKIAKMLAILGKKLENAGSKRARLHEIFHGLMTAKTCVFGVKD